MQRLPVASRYFIAAALFVFGLQHLVHGDFVTQLVPKLPATVPASRVLAYLFGAYLIASAGIVALALKPARAITLSLSGIAALSFLGLYLPRLLPDIRNGALWTPSFKACAFIGMFLALATTFGTASPRDSHYRLVARLCFAAFLIVAGIQHFIYAAFVDTLVPGWIPLPPRFWTLFSAVALLAGGAGLLLPKTYRLAALLTGGMIFAWVWTLHLYRAIGSPANANEVTAFFEALAFSGLGFLLATDRPGSVPENAAR